MPQGQRKYADFDAVTSPQPKAQKYGDFDQTTAPQPEVSLWENLQTGIARGALDYVVKPGVALMDALGNAAAGDFRPLSDMAERAGRGALEFASAFDPMGNAYEPTLKEQAPRMAELRKKGEERQGDNVRMIDLGLQQEEAKDQSLKGRITRGAGAMLTGAAPAIATGVLSGGSIPAVTATTALQSAAEPQNLPVNVALSAAPVPPLKALASPILKRIRGAAPEAAAASPASQLRAMGPVEEMASIRTKAGLPEIEAVSTSPRTAAELRAIGPRANFEAELADIPMEKVTNPSLTNRVGAALSDIYNLPRALMASGDISAPLRQGALLTLPPSQWGKAARAGVRMFEAFSTKRYNRIVDEIGAHPDMGAAEASGLFLSTRKGAGLHKAEEDFISRFADRIPIVKHSQQAYETYLDSLRMDTFAKYRKVIDAGGFTPAQRDIAYKAAADWINIASGRGSLGQTLDKAMPALNHIFFAPRYMASRLNVLNPVMYARNAATPEGRVILKQQMSELLQFAGMVATTYQLAKAAGAEVELRPGRPDFLKIRFGDYRYDPLAGLQQVMRLVWRTGADISLAAQGKKARHGESALDVAGRFFRSKLGPIPAYFTDFLARKTFTGEPFSATGGLVERLTPIMWNDWIEAFEKEGMAGVAKVSPGVIGVSVQEYESSPLDNLLEPISDELERLGVDVHDFRQKPDETPDQRRQRTERFGQLYSSFGARLINSDQYRAASDDDRKEAVKLLNVRTKDLVNGGREGEAPLKLSPTALFDALRQERERRNSYLSPN